MVDEEILKKLKNKIRDEVEERLACLEEAIQNETEEIIYRESKVFVFAKSIENNLENFLINNKQKQQNIENFILTFLYEDNIIETFYSYLHETNGTKYDFFINEVELLDSIEFFLKHR